MSYQGEHSRTSHKGSSRLFLYRTRWSVLRFAGYVATTQFCHCCMKAAVDSVYMNECGSFLIKLYIQKTGNGLDLLTCDL